MTVNDIFQKVLEYSKDNPVTAVSVGVVAVYLLFKRPVIFFILVVLGLVLVGESKLFSQLSAIGLGGN